jgi:hypothetical protein
MTVAPAQKCSNNRETQDRTSRPNLFLYGVTSQDGSAVFQPPSRRFAPIRDTPLHKKQFGVFLQIFHILRKKGEVNFKIGGIG